MKLVGLSKGGRDPIDIVGLTADEDWRIEGEFVVVIRANGSRSMAQRIPSHVRTIYKTTSDSVTSPHTTPV